MRYGVLEPSMLVSQRVFQNISLPLKKARLTPASRAASTFARCVARPVLVVADRQEHLVLEQLGPGAVGVDARDVADVVAVALEPAHHRVLGVEDAVVGPSRAARGERPVVADLVRAGRPASAGVEAVAAVVVVGLPGRVRGLERAGRSGRRRRARRTGCGSRRRCRSRTSVRDVDARTRRRRGPPTTRRLPQLPQSTRPVAGVSQARGLVLRQRRRRG